MTASVALVLVSHSRALAEGLAELAAQMAPDVVIVPAGGTRDGRLGTGVNRVRDALTAATTGGRSAVLVADLGSAVLTAELVLELLEEDLGHRARLALGPFVEGAVAAAVAAQAGGGLDDVARAVVEAGALLAPAGSVPAGAGAPGPASADPVPDRGETITGRVTLRNPLGLHARPAAILARRVAEFDAHLTVDGANGASVLQLMRLTATGGQELTLEASGTQAREVLDAAVELILEGFGEVPPVADEEVAAR